MIDQKNHADLAPTVCQLQGNLVDVNTLMLRFCGRAYPKFGIDTKVVHERSNTKIGIIKSL